MQSDPQWLSNQPRRDVVTTPGIVGMRESDQGKNYETGMDVGSAMLMQRDGGYCTMMHGHILRFDDGAAPFSDDLTKQ